MSTANRPKAKKRFDGFGLLLALAFAAVAVGAGYLALHFGWFDSTWKLLLFIAILVVAVAGVALEGAPARQATVAHSRWAERGDLGGIAESVASPEAQAAIEAGDQGPYLGGYADGRDYYALRYQGGLHMLCFGPPGAGKSMSLVVPNLSHVRRSLIVIDPKGELAAITARKRATFGKVIVLNPFGLLIDEDKAPHLASAGWNPLMQLDPDGVDFEGDARTIADALIEKSGGTHSRFFDTNAENIVTAFIMWERFTKRDQASLINIRAELSLPTIYDKKTNEPASGFLHTLKCMSECKEQRAIRDVGARAYGRFTDKYAMATSAQDVIDTALSNLGFLSNDLIAADMAFGGAIDFGALHREVTTVYLILPLKDLTKQAKWLRLFVNLALAKLYETSPMGSASLPPVMLVLDEFGNLGKLSQIVTALTTARGLRIQLWMFLQNLAQLKTHYKDEWTNFFTGSGAITTFRTGDNDTAEYLANVYGNQEQTVQTQTRSGGSLTPQAMPLIRKEDLGRIPDGEVINLIKPCPWPIRASSPVYPHTRFKDGLDANPYYQE
jgi:type IV secretion system protein VirD4